jgi:Zn-dependent metalloprotease
MQQLITSNHFAKASLGMLLCMGTHLFAQQTQRLAGTQVLAENQETHLPGFIQFNPGNEIRSEQFSTWVGTALDLPVSATLQPYQVESDELGYTHTRYKQTVNGIPVEGTMIITHAKNGVIESVNGDYFKNFKTSYSRAAVLSEATALKAALNKVNATSYMWENKAVEANLREALHNPDFTYAPKGELVIVHKENADYSAANMVLAYKFDIFAEEPFTRQHIFVDAVTGQVVAVENLLHAADETGTANTLYSGSRTISSSKSGSTYSLLETDRGNTSIETKTWPSKASITNSSATWNITNSDRYGLDAHWGAEMSYDYYKKIHNRNSLDNKGIRLLSYIHNSDNMNAYWTGDYMLYGDGNGNDVKAFAALDVCGHELTHGVITNSANLTYSNESGALNEGLADIFGTCIEAFARPGANEHNWIMGSDFTTNNSWQRSLKDPKAHSKPDTYKGTNWATGTGDNGGVHTNSGPIGHWFYLLTEGGKSTNDNNDAFDVTGIGIDKASKIALRALVNYMTASTNYANARIAAIKAATDLYGSCSIETQSTTNAFYAIGVGAAYVSAAVTANFAASTTAACTLPANVKFTNTTANGSTYTWDFGDGTATSTDKDPVHTYTKAGTYTVKLTAMGCTGTSSDDELKTSYITINPPADPVTKDTFRCGQGPITLKASGTGTLKWYDGQGTLLGSGPTYLVANLTATTTYFVTNGTAGTTATGGPADASIGTKGIFDNVTDRYLVFDVLAAGTLKTVDVEATAAGVRVIALRDSNGAILDSTSVNVPTGVSTVTLNFPLTVGTAYQLAVIGTANLQRNSAGAVFPYTVGSFAKITGTNFTTASYYYYFYKWVIESEGCSSASVPVIAKVETCTGIDKEGQDAGIEVYPNPASSLLNIKSAENITTVAVVDMLGKVVMQDASVRKNNTQLNIAELPSGFYFVKVNTAEAQKLVKIIKQ